MDHKAGTCKETPTRRRHLRFAVFVVRRGLEKPENNNEKLQSLANLPPVSGEALFAESPPLSLLAEAPDGTLPSSVGEPRTIFGHLSVVFWMSSAPRAVCFRSVGCTEPPLPSFQGQDIQPQ